MDLKFNIICDIEEAKEVWKKLSPDNSIYDNWDFRLCFYKYFKQPLHFIVGKIDNEEVGLLPLQYNDEKKLLEFFGGNFMEDNMVFVKSGYEECIAEFYKNISKPARLEDIIGKDFFTESLDIFEYKYVADFSGINNLDEYLKKIFKTKTMKKVKKRYAEIDSMGVQIIDNRFKDIETMIELNKKMFGEDSSFNKPYRREIFNDLLKSELDCHTISFLIKGKLEAVAIYLKYKDTFVSLNSGLNKQKFPNLSTYMILKRLEKAISLKSKTYDAGTEDLGWKESWHFEKVPERIYTTK